MHIRFFWRMLLLSVSLGLTSPLSAQSLLSPPKAESKEQENTDSPRFMMRQFLEILDQEETNLAFSFVEMPPGLGLSGKRHLMQQFFEVLNRRGNIDLALISNSPGGKVSDSIFLDIEVIGTIRTSMLGNVPVELHLDKEKTRTSWKFSRDFMERIPAIAEELEASGIETHLPPFLIHSKFLGIKAWQFLGMLAAILLSCALAVVITWCLFRVLRQLSKRLKVKVSDEIIKRLNMPFSLFTGIWAFSHALQYLEIELSLRQNLVYVEAIALTITFCIFAIRLTQVCIEMSRLSYERQGKTSAMAILGPIQKGIIILIWVAGFIMLLRSLGFDVTAILAGLGIGGVAIALAGQKTIENLFGGISIILDQPVRVGDFGRFGTIMGTVEDIGLRSTRVRTLDRTIVSIPNAEFSHMTLENFERRDKLRWHITLSVRMETSTDQMVLLITRLKELLLSHPMVYNDPARVRFIAIKQGALDIEMFCYIKCTDHNEYLAVVEDLNLRIIQIIRSTGTDFALPAQAVYNSDRSVIPVDAYAAASKAIEDLRSKGEFPLPHYPQAWSEARTDVLEFPTKT